MPRQIDVENCLNCGSCITSCPVEAIAQKGDKPQIDPNECVDCQTCWRICPEKCIDGGPDKFLELKTR